jgi:transcriptional regulator with XRE-family HTH domain
LAKKVNISRHALERFENGALGLSATTIEKLCDVLDIDRLRRAKAHLAEVARLAGAQA